MGLATLVWRNLWRRKLRTALTLASMAVALFLLCVLRAFVVTLDAGAKSASSQRLIVQSAVSLFVELPLSYQARMATVPGVENVLKWQWFGGYYKDPKNVFAQFAVDPEHLLDVYPEVQIVDGSFQDFLADRRGCIVGERLIEKWKDEGWEVGKTVPIIGDIFPNPAGSDEPWEFTIDAVYHPTQRYFDAGILLFHWDYFEKTMEQSPFGVKGVGTYVVRIEDGADATAVMRGIDELYENGPQRVQATSESDFNMQFVSMMGNVPFFVSTIGGGVLVAILLAVVNTMLMSGREQTHDLGILKALGFSDAKMRALLAAQSLFLCVLGGGLGLVFVLAVQPSITKQMGQYFPGFHVTGDTFALAGVVAVALGLVAGLVPAVRAGRLRPVEALSSEE